MTPPALRLARFGPPASPDAPAEGLHYELRGALGLLVPPPNAKRGACWFCGGERRPDVPLCRECREIAWGEGDVRVVSVAAGGAGA